MIAQCAFHLRLLVAEAAEVDLFDVSLPLLLKEAPRFLARGEDPVAVIPTLGAAGGYYPPKPVALLRGAGAAHRSPGPPSTSCPTARGPVRRAALWPGRRRPSPLCAISRYI